MNVNSVSVNQSTSAEATKGKKALRTVGAFATATIVPQILQNGIAIGACEGMGYVSRNLPKNSIEMVNKGAEKVVNELTNLASKGVKIVDGRNIDPFGFQTMTFSGSSIGAKIKNYLMDFINPIQGIKNGKNAAFSTSHNAVAYHPEKMSLAAFHELGHAHNHNNSKFWKFIQQHCRKPAVFIPFALAAFVALTKNSKPEEGKELNFAQKTKNFIRNNGASLAFASTIPMVAEEVAASIKGCKWASKVLNKSLARKVLATNILGATTYLAIGGCFALGIHWAKKIKDKSAN